MNWTGSITRIGRGTSNNYSNQLKGIIKDSINSIISKINYGKTLNLSYSFFGLHVPQGKKGPNPDFEQNYIKTFLKNRSSFDEADWEKFTKNLTKENRGYFTAQTVARELSTVLTSSSEKSFEENYFILITDPFFNIVVGQTFTQEIE